MLSSMDDYPLHQIPDVIRHVGTSDRNFYDRYYFNLHATSGELCVILGLGQYPNLGIQDAFALARRGTEHRVVRASRTLGDRMDTSVGPFRVEVLEGLRRVRFVLEPNEHGIELDLSFDGAMPAFQEPRQYIRRHGRVLFDTARFAQTGRWRGHAAIAGEPLEISPAHQREGVLHAEVRVLPEPEDRAELAVRGVQVEVVAVVEVAVAGADVADHVGDLVQRVVVHRREHGASSAATAFRGAGRRSSERGMLRRREDP